MPRRTTQCSRFSQGFNPDSPGPLGTTFSVQETRTQAGWPGCPGEDIGLHLSSVLRQSGGRGYGLAKEETGFLS